MGPLWRVWVGLRLCGERKGVAESILTFSLMAIALVIAWVADAYKKGRPIPLLSAPSATVQRQLVRKIQRWRRAARLCGLKLVEYDVTHLVCQGRMDDHTVVLRAEFAERRDAQVLKLTLESEFRTPLGVGLALRTDVNGAGAPITGDEHFDEVCAPAKGDLGVEALGVLTLDVRRKLVKILGRKDPATMVHVEIDDERLTVSDMMGGRVKLSDAASDDELKRIVRRAFEPLLEVARAVEAAAVVSAAGGRRG